jgi:hypothetical protein
MLSSTTPRFRDPPVTAPPATAYDVSTRLKGQSSAEAEQERARRRFPINARPISQPRVHFLRKPTPSAIPSRQEKFGYHGKKEKRDYVFGKGETEGRDGREVETHRLTTFHTLSTVDDEGIVSKAIPTAEEAALLLERERVRLRGTASVFFCGILRSFPSPPRPSLPTPNAHRPLFSPPQDVPDTSATKYKGVGWSKSHTQRQGIPALPTSANPAPVYDVSGMTSMGKAGRTDSQDLPYMRAKPAPFFVRSWAGP